MKYKNIDNFGEFILEYDVVHDTRSKPIKLDKGVSVMDFLKRKVPWYFENDITTPIYRGLSGERYNKNKILKINPSEYKRYARNTDSQYLSMMDESPHWSEYPQRGKSIICSTTYNYAKAYGEVYRVIPLKENSIFSLCPAKDIFYSFKHLFDGLKSMGFNFGHSDHRSNFAVPTLNDLMITLSGPVEDEEVNRDIMSNGLYNFQQSLDEYEEYKEYDWHYDDMIKGFVKKYIEGDIVVDDLYDHIEELMNPVDNGFKLIQYNSAIDITEEREIYTDTDCLLVLESEFTGEKIPEKSFRYF